MSKEDFRNEKLYQATMGIHEDDLRRLSAEALGLAEFDPDAFSEKIDHVTIAKGGHIAFHFKDGGIFEAVYSTKRRSQPWTDAQRAKFKESIKGAFTPERRRRMSEHMKQLRKERGDQWRKQ